MIAQCRQRSVPSLSSPLFSFYCRASRRVPVRHFQVIWYPCSLLCSFHESLAHFIFPMPSGIRLGSNNAIELNRSLIIRTSLLHSLDGIHGLALVENAILHDDSIVHFHECAIAFVPERCFAVAVASAGAGDHMRQLQLAAFEPHIHKIVLWLEPSHHGLPARAAKS